MARRSCASFTLVLALSSVSVTLPSCAALVETDRKFDRARSDGGSSPGPLRAEPLGQLESEHGGQDAFGLPVAFAGDLLLVASAGLSTLDTRQTGGALLYDTRQSPPVLRGSFSSPRPEEGGGVCSGVKFVLLANVSPPCVGVATDGTTFVLGLGNQSVTVDGTTLAGAGAVYVFEQGDGGAWSLVQELTAGPQARAKDAFGFRVALSGDVLAVSAPWNDGAGEDTGAVYTFRRRTGTYELDAVVRPEIATAGDLFGIALALQGDLLVASAPLETGIGQGVDADPALLTSALAGAVYAFELQEGGYRQEAYLKPTEPPTSRLFGASLALQGSTLAVGAPAFPTGSGVYVYERGSDGWRAAGGALRPRDYEPSSFGTSVALDGNLLVVGAPNDRSASPGVHRAPVDTPKDAQDTRGAAHVYERTPSGFTYTAYLKTEAPREIDLFGSSVAVSGDLVAVGAPSGGRAPVVPTELPSGVVHLFRHLPVPGD